MDNIVSALTFVGLLLGLLVVADQIMSKDARRSLGLNIRRRISGRGRDIPDVNNPISFIESIRPFSFRSALVSALMSLVALALVIYVQFFALDYDFRQMFEGVPEGNQNRFAAFIFYMIIANVVVDYISFTQTLVIVRLINKTDSRKSLFVLLFTDLLASINIFTFAYSFFLVFGLIHLLNEDRVWRFVVSVERQEMPPAIPEIFRGYGVDSSDHMKQLTTLRFYAMEPKVAEAGAALIASNEEVTTDQVLSMLNSRLIKAFPTDAFQLEKSVGEINPYETFPDLTDVYQLKGQVKGNVNSKGAFAQWYSVAYLLTDDVQDNFFSVTGLSPGFQKIDDLRRAGNARTAEALSGDTLMEFCRDGGSLRMEPGECVDVVSMVSSDIGVLDKKIAGEQEIGGELPLYTFFFTSLALTSTIYLFYLSTFIIRGLYMITARYSLPVAQLGNFEEHPLTLVSLPIVLIAGTVYYFLTL